MDPNTLPLMTAALVKRLIGQDSPAPEMLSLAEELPANLKAFVEAIATNPSGLELGNFAFFAPQEPELPVDGKAYQIGMLLSGEPIIAKLEDEGYRIIVAGFDGAQELGSIEELLIGEYFKCLERGATFPLAEDLPANFEEQFY